MYVFYCSTYNQMPDTVISKYICREKLCISVMKILTSEPNPYIKDKLSYLSM